MSVTATIRECHRLRKHLKALQEEIDRGPRVLKARQARLEAERQAHAEHHQAIDHLKRQQRADEGALKEVEARLAKLEDQLTKISVTKEYEAKQSEIRQAREKKGSLEDAILATIAALEQKQAAVPAVEQKWADAQAEFAAYQEEARERLERLKAEQQAAREELARVEAAIPAKVRPTYDTWVKAHGPDAMAAVKDGFCLGCRTNVTQQVLLNLQAGSFVTCASCGKLLYPAE